MFFAEVSKTALHRISIGIEYRDRLIRTSRNFLVMCFNARLRSKGANLMSSMRRERFLEERMFTQFRTFNLPNGTLLPESKGRTKSVCFGRPHGKCT